LDRLESYPASAPCAQEFSCGLRPVLI